MLDFRANLYLAWALVDFFSFLSSALHASLKAAFASSFFSDFLTLSHPFSGITFKSLTIFNACYILGSSVTIFFNFLSNTIASGTEEARSLILSDNLVS